MKRKWGGEEEEEKQEGGIQRPKRGKRRGRG